MEQRTAGTLDVEEEIGREPTILTKGSSRGVRRKADVLCLF